MLAIGAGGAGLRAAIEAASTGASVGIVCKSLLGKAHTVMAEGGVAAALANVDERDGVEACTSPTPCAAAQYLNNPRMAELHAREAPDRVRELESWGALFDRTRPTAASCSATSAVTNTRASRTSATAPGSR